MNNTIIIAAAIIAAAIIVKLPPIGPNPPGRFQPAGEVTLIDTTTGARWGWMGPAGWRQFSTGVTP